MPLLSLLLLALLIQSPLLVLSHTSLLSLMQSLQLPSLLLTLMLTLLPEFDVEACESSGDGEGGDESDDGEAKSEALQLLSSSRVWGSSAASRFPVEALSAAHRAVSLVCASDFSRPDDASNPRGLDVSTTE